MPLSDKTQVITVGARPSPLSQVQVKEVQGLLESFHPHIELDPVWVETEGDRDQQTSLRDLPKTDFFTRDIDSFLLLKKCRIAVHSAKDLPEQLAPGLEIIAITEGVDRRDALVIPEGETIEALPQGACIATSSVKREEAVLKLRSDFTFTDLRGTIHKRLDLLQFGHVDGVVIAEAALIRLQLTHLNRVFLPGDTTPLQGQLAIVSLEGDEEMKKLFACLDAR